MTTIGEVKFGTSTYIKEYFEAKDPSKPAYTNVASTLFAPSKLKQVLFQSLNKRLNYFHQKKIYLKCYHIVTLIWRILVDKDSCFHYHSR